MTKVKKTKFSLDKPLSSGSIAKFIVNKFIDKKTINWARDVKGAKKLVEKFPKFEFWQALPRQTFVSIACMMTERAKSFLKYRYNLFNLNFPKQEKYELEEKIIESSDFSPRPKTLLEFLH